jgi:hypothetical protein
MSEIVRIRIGVEAETDFFKSDNTCLHVVFYDDEKQFINQSRTIYSPTCLSIRIFTN